MATKAALDQALLLSILSQYTAPFREGHVVKRVTDALDRAGVPHFSDPVGNVIVGASSQKEYLSLIRPKNSKTESEPVRVFIAHMDHPGFHGASWKSPTELEFTWHGGSPTQHLTGAKVWLADKNRHLGFGKVASAELHSSGRWIEKGVVTVSPSIHALHPKASDIFGGFAFREPVWQEGELLYTQVADDLVGVFSIVTLASELFKKRGSNKKRPPFLGLLTRAEEVGFIGAIGHFELGWLQSARRPILCVSLETSRAMPGAEFGKGPVVRLGDRTTVFDPAATRVFSDLALKLLPEKHQRKLMDGGSCEATAATVYGFPCVGISVPLGNYHNQSFEGGPDSAGPLGPAPEFVHLQDAAGLIELCRGLLQPRLPWKKAWQPRAALFKKELKRYRELLRSGP